MTRVAYDDVTLPEADTAKVSIDVEGADEDVVEKVAMHARDEAVRALQAFEEGKHPSECEGVPHVSLKWYHILDLEPPSYPNGIYLIADTPKTATPLAVEDGSGDRALLREALAEEGIEIAEPVEE